LIKIICQIRGRLHKSVKARSANSSGGQVVSGRAGISKHGRIIRYPIDAIIWQSVSAVGRARVIRHAINIDIVGRIGQAAAADIRDGSEYPEGVEIESKTGANVFLKFV
jgi:hypothetical protein